VLWGLPQFDIHIPWWGLSILMVVLAVYSFITYRMGRLALIQKPIVAPDSIIGTEGKVVKPLTPVGSVKVQGVLWKAVCAESQLETDDEVVVVGIDRLKLIVILKRRSSPPAGRR